jgi:hypothetical protein
MKSCAQKADSFLDHILLSLHCLAKLPSKLQYVKIQNCLIYKVALYRILFPALYTATFCSLHLIAVPQAVPLDDINCAIA